MDEWMSGGWSIDYLQGLFVGVMQVWILCLLYIANLDKGCKEQFGKSKDYMFWKG